MRVNLDRLKVLNDKLTYLLNEPDEFNRVWQLGLLSVLLEISTLVADLAFPRSDEVTGATKP